MLNLLTTVKEGEINGKTRALYHLSGKGPLGLRTNQAWGLIRVGNTEGLPLKYDRGDGAEGRDAVGRNNLDSQSCYS